MKKMIVAPVAVLVVFATGLMAASSRNYWYAGGRPDAWYSDQDWMGRLRNDTRLSQLSIPGTHDSGAYVAGGVVALTQQMNFLDQLIAGIRMWDVRVAGPSSGTCGVEETLYIYHGPICQGSQLRDAIQAAVIFLYNHPNETVLMRIKKEEISPLTDRASDSFLVLLESVLRNTTVVRGTETIRAADYLYKGSEANPTLGSLRKKIFLFKDFPGDLPTTLAYTRPWCSSPSDYCLQPLEMQDNYNLSSNFDLANKWRAVQTHLRIANNTFAVEANKLYVNFSSATALQNSGSGFPFFFASGQIVPQNGAAQLWTGFTTQTCPRFICLPEFPVDSLGFVYYQGINQLLAIELFLNSVRNRTGIVLMDFPGGGVIGDIIAFNNRHRVTQAPVANPNPSSDPSRWYNGGVNLSWNWQGATTLVNCDTSLFVTREGRNAPSSTCRDIAGLQGTAVVQINIDYVAPTGMVKLSRPVISRTTTGRPVVQAVAGSFADTLSGIDPNTGRYRIEDSYGGTIEGRVTFTPAVPSGATSLDPNAYFLFQVSLNTMARPNEPRTYRITVSAADRAGNPVQVSAEAVVR